MPRPDLLLSEIDEAITWVGNEYGFVTDVLKKARAELNRLHSLCVSHNKLKVFLYEHFDQSFSCPWDELPEHVQEHWTKVAEALGPELLSEGIVYTWKEPTNA